MLCLCFATHCKFGKQCSQQVVSIVNTVLQAGAGFSVGVVGVIAVVFILIKRYLFRRR